WKGIHNALHSRRRWYGIGLILLLITTATVTTVMLIPGSKTGRLASTTGILAKQVASIDVKTPVPSIISPSANSSTLHHYPGNIEPHFLVDNNSSQPSNNEEDYFAAPVTPNNESLNKETELIERTVTPGRN